MKPSKLLVYNKKHAKENNVSFTVRNKLCTGCGICEDVCPNNCIHIHRINGEYRPVVTTARCAGHACRRCMQVCPGTGTDLVKIATEKFSGTNISKDKHIGRYVNIHVGNSTNHDIRYHSASGGIVSQFLIFLLEKGIINGAVVTKFSDTDHLTPVSYIARTREEILAGRSSKYCPVTLNKIGNEIAKSNEGRYVIIGLPCHIQGFRKREMADKKFRQRIVGYFSLYCSSTRTFYAQDFLLKMCKVSKNSLTYFAYRDNGCLGNLTVKQQGEPLIQIPYTRYYGHILRSFFKPHRCLTCIDHYGELADVCFGDIHTYPYNSDKTGISSWIVRNSYYEKLFQQAAQEGYITMKPLDAMTLNSSQSTILYSRKRLAQAQMNIDRLAKRKTAQYDTFYLYKRDKPRLRDYAMILSINFQRFIGRHPQLWFIINVTLFLHDVFNKKYLKNKIR